MQKAFRQFENDSQLKHAISSLYVINARTGKVVFDKNSRVGLAGASTQKIITASTAFELLGRTYQYKTSIYMNGSIDRDTLLGDIIIKGTGDPTFGSFRYAQTKRELILASIGKIFAGKKIRFIHGNIIVDENSFETNTTPDGWIWQDIGNYYGAGASALNWNDNQYDLILKPGLKENEAVEILRTDPEMDTGSFLNELRTGAKGSGDNGYIYYPPYSHRGFVRGTIPLGTREFTISGSLPLPSMQFLAELRAKMEGLGIRLNGKLISSTMEAPRNLSYDSIPIVTVQSPALDSIVYWFLKKSINLYGEAMIKTMAFNKTGTGTTHEGLDIVRSFWKEKGIDEDELNMYDGSGLSPLNRITTHAQVEILKFARTRDWYAYFYDALPEYNGMKMKSGTINDAKGFCGYHQARNGEQYIFSFLVNNYSGSTTTLVNKMFKVLDVLK